MYIIDASLRSAFYSALVLPGRRAIKTLRTYPFSNRKITNMQDIELAIAEIYNSGIIFPRGLLAKRTGTPNVSSIISGLGNKVYNYFNQKPNTANNQLNFDKFHDDLCQYFISSLNAQRSRIGLANITYGQAQKLINVMFKYLSCYGDYNNFADLFSYCHMPIDTIILNSLGSYYGVKSISSKKYKGKCWTKFDRSTYMSLVSDYRSAISGLKGNHSYLAVEFYIWRGVTKFPSKGLHAASILDFYS